MITTEVKHLMKKSGDEGRCETMLAITQSLLAAVGISMSEAQWLSLVSHLSAMVYRSVNNDPIPPVDKGMFQEVSAESIELAAKVCEMLPELHEDEKYLLSIHFESAKITNEMKEE
ncbi:PRD domain protein EF_0829/AHA_3910 [Evansella caseinilytica]|uniref:PRD domain protein EF_0829/AHA_3910 n=1 Tax=Evansella caseinilytica TaxID=1503961 RepID=A0A1H3HJH8_9BACI|nr:PRD domain-containing protein [Evansella caseinilytica]SDY14958.1 PRD domain protein EF_0829/AHA_3910 [Evansella caseinilytica]